MKAHYPGRTLTAEEIEMARPRKENLDYFPFDVDFFSDKKIKRLKAKFGADGIAVYLFAICEIYRNSYYTEYDDDFILDISDHFHYSESKTMQIMNYLFSRSLLECILVGSVKVITAPSVQRRYQEAKQGAKRDIAVDKRIWLLKKEETRPFIKVYPSDNFSEKNEGYSEKNDSKSEKNDIKESKGKESKGKENKVCMFEIPCKNGTFIVDEEYYNNLTHTYPNMDIDKCFKKMLNFTAANPQKRLDWNGTKNRIENWLYDDNEAGKYRKKERQTTYDIDQYEATNAILEEGF